MIKKTLKLLIWENPYFSKFEPLHLVCAGDYK